MLLRILGGDRRHTYSSLNALTIARSGKGLVAQRSSERRDLDRHPVARGMHIEGWRKKEFTA
jgi:hypothetical protein